MSTPAFIPSLTPLRGIAASLVVFFHFHLLLSPLTPEDNHIISKWYLMVDLFFVLSGFIMAHVYGSWFRDKVTGKAFGGFMKARFARIYPLHLFTFLYLLVVAFYFRSQVNFQEIPHIFQMILDNSAIPGVLTLTQAWGTHMEASWNTASWSISVEWLLYLVFPVFALLLHRNKRLFLPVFGVAAFIALWLLAAIIVPEWRAKISAMRQLGDAPPAALSGHSIDIITGFALLRGWAGFIFGMIAYELYQRQIGQALFRNGSWFLLTWLVLLGCWYRDLLPDPFAIPIFSLLILQAAYMEGSIKRLFNGRVLTYLGDISYSIYMVHIPIILTVFLFTLIGTGGKMPPPDGAEVNYLQNWIGALIFFLIVLALASLTYRWIEKPARKRLKKVSTKD